MLGFTSNPDVEGMADSGDEMSSPRSWNERNSWDIHYNPDSKLSFNIYNPDSKLSFNIYNPDSKLSFNIYNPDSKLSFNIYNPDSGRPFYQM